MSTRERGEATRVLIISHDVVDAKMAGPGIRYWEFAQALSREFQVTLAVPGQTTLAGEGFIIQPFTLGQAESLAPLIAAADVVVTFGYLLHDHPELGEIQVPLVIDAYIPYPFEALAQNAGHPLPDQVAAVDAALEDVLVQFRAGDFFLCASERQRDLWLGLLLALGRVNPHTYADDPTLRRLIDVVPFGLPADPPRHTKVVLRGLVEGISPNDRIILWGGGIWQWLDPLTLIRAMAQIIRECPEVKLVFPGTRHPFHERVLDMPMRHRAIKLAETLGLLNRWVFFGDWVPYADWPNYLLEADIGVSLHFNTIEAQFASRTRILDYIWAGLPIVATKGDAMSEVIKGYNLGELVDPENVEQLTRTLLNLLNKPHLREAYRANFEKACRQFSWDKVIKPLAAFCRNPRQAPDKVALGGWSIDNRIRELERALRAKENEIAALQDLVERFRRGRFIRTMAKIAEIQAKVLRVRGQR